MTKTHCPQTVLVFVMAGGSPQPGPFDVTSFKSEPCRGHGDLKLTRVTALRCRDAECPLWVEKRTLADAHLTVYPGVMTNLKRALVGALLTLALTSCQPPDRDVVVAMRKGQLVVDFPWSLWRVIGLQSRTYCIRRVELFDRTGVLWSLNVPEGEPVYHSCLDVAIPAYLGKPLAGFVSKGRPQLNIGQPYGVAIDGTGNGRVDFILGREGPTNITEPDRQMEAPCGSQFSDCRMPATSG